MPLPGRIQHNLGPSLNAASATRWRTWTHPPRLRCSMMNAWTVALWTLKSLLILCLAYIVGVIGFLFWRTSDPLKTLNRFVDLPVSERVAVVTYARTGVAVSREQSYFWQLHHSATIAKHIEQNYAESDYADLEFALDRLRCGLGKQIPSSDVTHVYRAGLDGFKVYWLFGGDRDESYVWIFSR